MTEVEYSPELRKWLNGVRFPASKPVRASATVPGHRPLRDQLQGEGLPGRLGRSGRPQRRSRRHFRPASTLLTIDRLKIHRSCMGLIDEMPGYSCRSRTPDAAKMCRSRSMITAWTRFGMGWQRPGLCGSSAYRSPPSRAYVHDVARKRREPSQLPSQLPPYRARKRRARKRRDPGQLRLWPIGWALTICFAAAVTGLGGLTWIALTLLSHPKLPHSKVISLHDTVGVAQLVFASVAGAGALVALVMAYRRQRVTEAAPKRKYCRARPDPGAE